MGRITGTGNLDNDTAEDWIMDFLDEPSEIKILSAFRLISDRSGTLEIQDCQEALAAAEILALINNKPNPDFDKQEIDLIVNSGLKLPDTIFKVASDSIKKIQLQSELRELWDEQELTTEWHDVIHDLQARLL